MFNAMFQSVCLSAWVTLRTLQYNLLISTVNSMPVLEHTDNKQNLLLPKGVNARSL